MAELVVCPACGRKVRLNALGTDVNGDRVMSYHWTAPHSFEECIGSNRSAKDAKEVCERGMR